MIKKLFVLSKFAGKNDFTKFKEEILKVYEKNNRTYEVEVVITEDENHAKRLAKEFSKSEIENKILISCGGDGTLGEIAEVLCGTNTALGLIPMGTGNDFSKNFDYRNFKIESTFEPNIAPIDVMDINGRKCINVMSLGFDTIVLKNTYDYLDKFKFLGKNAFVLGVLKSLFHLSHEKLECELRLKDGREIKLEGEYTITALCNGGYYGSGFNPAPCSKIDDGILNLVVVDKINLKKIIPLITKYKKGTHMGNEKIHEYLVKSGKIISNREFLYNIDGEIYRTDEIEFKIIENGILWGYFE